VESSADSGIKSRVQRLKDALNGVLFFRHGPLLASFRHSTSPAVRLWMPCWERFAAVLHPAQVDAGQSWPGIRLSFPERPLVGVLRTTLCYEVG